MNDEERGPCCRCLYPEIRLTVDEDFDGRALGIEWAEAMIEQPYYYPIFALAMLCMLALMPFNQLSGSTRPTRLVMLAATWLYADRPCTCGRAALMGFVATDPEEDPENMPDDPDEDSDEAPYT